MCFDLLWNAVHCLWLNRQTCFGSWLLQRAIRKSSIFSEFNPWPRRVSDSTLLTLKGQWLILTGTKNVPRLCIMIALCSIRKYTFEVARPMEMLPTPLLHCVRLKLYHSELFHEHYEYNCHRPFHDSCKVRTTEHHVNNRFYTISVKGINHRNTLFCWCSVSLLSVSLIRRLLVLAADWLVQLKYLWPFGKNPQSITLCRVTTATTFTWIFANAK